MLSRGKFGSNSRSSPGVFAVLHCLRCVSVFAFALLMQMGNGRREYLAVLQCAQPLNTRTHTHTCICCIILIKHIYISHTCTHARRHTYRLSLRVVIAHTPCDTPSVSAARNAAPLYCSPAPAAAV